MNNKSTHNPRPDAKRSNSWRSFLRPPPKSPVPSSSSTTTNNTKANNNNVTKAKNSTTPSPTTTTTPYQPHPTPNPNQHTRQHTQHTQHNQHTEQTHQIWQAQETLRTFITDTWPQHASSVRIECHVPLSALYPLLGQPLSNNNNNNILNIHLSKEEKEKKAKEEEEKGLQICRRLVRVPGPLHEEVAKGVWVFLRGLAAAAEAAAASAAATAAAAKTTTEAVEYEKGGSGFGVRREEDREKAAAAQWRRHVKSFVRVVSPGSTASATPAIPPTGSSKTGSKTGLVVPKVKGTVVCPFCGGGCIPPPTMPTSTNTQVCQGRRSGGRWPFQRKQEEKEEEKEVEVAADPFWQREEDRTVLSSQEEDLTGLLLASQEEGSGVSRGKGRKGVEAFGGFFSSKDSKEGVNEKGEDKKKRGKGGEKKGARPGLKRGVPHKGK